MSSAGPVLNLGSGCLPRVSYNDSAVVNVDCERHYAREAGVIGASFLCWSLFDLPLPFVSGSFSGVNISQCLEHLHLNDALDVLHDCHRLLMPGGWIRVSVPDAQLLIDRLSAGSDMSEFAAVQPKIYSAVKSPMLRFGLILFGALSAHGEYGHKQCYDEAGLRECLHLTQFTDVRRAEFDPGLDAPIAEGHQLAVLAQKNR